MIEDIVYLILRYFYMNIDLSAFLISTFLLKICNLNMFVREFRKNLIFSI